MASSIASTSAQSTSSSLTSFASNSSSESMSSSSTNMFPSPAAIADRSETEGSTAPPAPFHTADGVDCSTLFHTEHLLHLKDTHKRLVLAMVGLPARGKTYISRRLERYLKWTGYQAKVFNIGAYRRQIAGAEQPASFFDPNNAEGLRMRNESAMTALNDMFKFFAEGGHAAIYDGTNSTNARRQFIAEYIRSRCTPQLQVELVWIESICTDEKIIELNIREHKLSSPDYAHMTAEAAVADFRARIQQYAKAYEPLPMDAEFPFVKIIDAGRQVITNRIRGYLMGKLVFFLMNLRVNHAPIFITRHGESQDNVRGTIGGDSQLTERGREYAVKLREFIRARDELKTQHPPDHHLDAHFLGSNVADKKSPSNNSDIRNKSSNNTANDTTPENGNSTTSNSDSSSSIASSIPLKKDDCFYNLHVWTSTLRRTVETGTFVGLPFTQWRALVEIHVGICDGLTYEEIESKYPHEFEARKNDKLNYRYPQGESYMDLVHRVEPVIFELERIGAPVLVICHRAVARCLYSYFLDLQPDSIPFVDVPLHTVMMLEPKAYGCVVTKYPLGVASVDDDKGKRQATT